MSARAFPSHARLIENGVATAEYELHAEGMSQREFFAAHALTSLAASISDPLEAAIRAFAYADAMLAVSVSREGSHELLEALKAIKRNCPCDPDINPAWLAAWNGMLAAIAKAEGDQR